MMQFAIIFTVVAFAWFAIGTFVTNIQGIILRKKLSSMMDMSTKETEKFTEEKVKESMGDEYQDTTKYDIWCNSLFWPHTVYRAFVGYRILKKNIRMGNIASNRGGES